jgi:EmrB/QacA subfamily drug resistance transporter
MSSKQKLILVISILASFVTFLDGSVVNVALPAISRELGGGLAVQQWVVDAYLLSLGSLILIAGSLSDVFGRKRILIAGLEGFGVTSLACALAPTSGVLISARALQGVAGAIIVPSALALIIANFSGESEGKAIGTWTAWTGISFIIGPLVGGVMVDAANWRWIFAINILPILITLWLMRRMAHDHPEKNSTLDYIGSALCALGLTGIVFGLIEEPHFGWAAWQVLLPLVVGLVLFGTFIKYESGIESPMLPLKLFRVRNFSVGNLATTMIYAALSVATFLIIIFMQQVGRYSALQSGLALLPVTILMFLLSPRVGALSGRFGPRFFMAVGPILAGLGFLMLLRVDSSVGYWGQIFPSILVFGLGLTLTVSPLTAAVLSSIDPKHAGIGSAINNAIARLAGLLAIAAIGAIVGGHINLHGFHVGSAVMAGLLFAGGVISLIGIQNPVRVH